jgi:hypothetical protein
MGKLSNAKKLTKTEQYAIQGMYSNGMKGKRPRLSFTIYRIYRARFKNSHNNKYHSKW